jgi:hypothetical protein
MPFYFSILWQSLAEFTKVELPDDLFGNSEKLEKTFKKRYVPISEIPNPGKTLMRFLGEILAKKMAQFTFLFL